MGKKITTRIPTCKLLVISLFALFISQTSGLDAGKRDEAIEARIQAVRAEVQEAIRKAENLAAEGKYADALRLLFDMMYKEMNTQFAIALFSEDLKKYEEFPMTAGDAIRNVEMALIRNDYSPLMQYFRDPEVPLQEKLLYIEELRTLARQKGQDHEDVVFRGQYRGTLVQLMVTRTLSTGEKIDVLFSLEEAVRDHYTPGDQKQQIRKDITQLQTMAEQKFQEQQYVEAFILIDEAKQKAMKTHMSTDMNLTSQEVHMEKEFVRKDQSPLMQVFKDRQISTKERQILLIALGETLRNRSQTDPDQLVFLGETYDGIFVRILLHPNISWNMKYYLLKRIEYEILMEEPDYLPDYEWKYDEEFMKLWEEYQNKLKKNDEN